MAKLFISYSRRDLGFAQRLYGELSSYGAKGFLDQVDIAVGADWSKMLKDAIETSDALVLILSKDAALSNFVMAEVGVAQGLGKKVIPVLAPGSMLEDSMVQLLSDCDRMILKGDQEH